MNADRIVIYRGESEWSALYLDGKLDTVGDHYLIDERIVELLGIEERHSEDFMCGGNFRDDVAKTVAEAEAWGAGREERVAEARKLRLQAHELQQRAERLEYGRG